jgi:hypothetical protein
MQPALVAGKFDTDNACVNRACKAMHATVGRVGGWSADLQRPCSRRRVGIEIMASITTSTAEIEARVAAAHGAYQALERRTLALLSDTAPSSVMPLGELLEACDEFGVDHAVDLFFRQPDVLAHHKGDEVGTASLASSLQSLLDAHDELDGLAQAREALAGPGQAVTRVFIQGHEYTIDATQSQAWPSAEPSNRFAFLSIEPGGYSPDARRLAARKRDLENIKNPRPPERDRDR